MNAKRNAHPLPLIGVVLLLNSVVLAVLSYAFQASGLYGVIIGCAVTGLALTVVGLVQSKGRESLEGPGSV